MYKKIVQDIYPFLTANIINYMENLNINNIEILNKITEIRIRGNKNVIVKLFDSDIVLDYIITNEDIYRIMEKISNYSIYAIQEDMNLGYITIKGGHRIGICGTSVIKENRIENIKNISSINIRIAREIIGCSNNVFNNLYMFEFNNTLIVSPPNAGKTTLLRDLIRNLSDNGNNICVIDERTEIGATYNGIMQMNLGIRTDILNKCLKHIGIINVIRSMNPDIIALDEIGSILDIEAIKQALLSGVKILVTAHGDSFENIQKGNIGKLLELDIFRYIIILEKGNIPGKVKKIIDLKNQFKKEVNLCIY